MPFPRTIIKAGGSVLPDNSPEAPVVETRSRRRSYSSVGYTWRAASFCVLGLAALMTAGCRMAEIDDAPYGRAPTALVTLYLDPRDCLGCAVRINRWVVAMKDHPDEVDILLTRKAQPHEQEDLMRARVRSTATLTPKQEGTTRGSRVAVRDGATGKVEWYSVLSPVIDSIMEGYAL